MLKSNEEFLKKLNKEFPNQNWDEITDNVEKIYKIEGIYEEKTIYKKLNKEESRQVDFVIDKEYKTKQDALNFVENMKTNSWSEEKLLRDNEFTSTFRIKLISTQIKEQLPEEIEKLLYFKDLREAALEDKQIFP